MKQKAAVPTTQSLSGNSLSLSRMTLDFLDTSWRIAVPVVLLAVAGLFADRAVNTAPLLTIAGMILGFIAAALLVKKQIAQVKQRGGGV